MGFFSKILSLFPWSKRKNASTESISQRIEELRLSSASNKEKAKVINTRSFAFTPIKYRRPPQKEFKVFKPREIGDITKMSSFIKKREEERKKYTEGLKSKVNALFAQVKQCISSENVSFASQYFKQTLPLLQEIKDEDLNNVRLELEQSLQALKDKLIQREIARQEAERKAREEAERQRRLAEERERQRLEQERREKERRAKEQEERIRAEYKKRQAEIERLTALVTRKKADAEAIKTYLSNNRVHQFYHFTDVRNLSKIRELGGLYSWYYCEKNGIKIPNPGGDDDSRGYDLQYGLHDYVRLSFCDDHPMAYRLQQEGASLVLLVIDVEVATFLETQFSDINAADSRHKHGGNIDALKRVDIEATKEHYVKNTSPSFKPHQAECMVKTFIPIKYIKNIDHPRDMH